MALRVDSSRRARISSKSKRRAVVRPLAAFEQQGAVRGEDEQPARRPRLGEDAAGDDGVPRFGEQGFRRRRFAVELQGVGLEGERVLAFAIGVAGAEHEQARAGAWAAGAADGAEDRHFAAVLQQVVGGLAGVAEGREQPGEPLALLEDAVSGAAFVGELAAEAEVLRREGAEFGVGRVG